MGLFNGKFVKKDTIERSALQEDTIDWIVLLNSWTTPPVFNQTIAAGDVYTYTYGSTLYYRLIPSTYDSESLHRIHESP